MSKLGRRFCVTNGGVNLGGIGGTKTKGGFHGRGRINNVVQRSFGYTVAGGNTSWQRMSVLVVTAAMRAGFYH